MLTGSSTKLPRAVKKKTHHLAEKLPKGFREKRSADDQWMGGRFVLVSVFITVLSIATFISLRHYFPGFQKDIRASFQRLAQRFAQIESVRTKAIDLEVLQDPDWNNARAGSPLAAFQSAADRSRNRLSIYYGQPFWLLDLEKVRDEILDEGWAKIVFVRRAFPNTLKIQIVPRAPNFLVRGSRQWTVTDSEGYAILVSKQIPGSWANLTTVLGLENSFSLGDTPKEINRQRSEDAMALKDLSELVRTLKTKLGWEIESVRVQKEPGTSDTVFALHLASEPKGFAVEAKDERPRSFEVLVKSKDWEDRIENLQFVLSDLRSKHAFPSKILGQFHGRWFVQLKSSKELL